MKPISTIALIACSFHLCAGNHDVEFTLFHEVRMEKNLAMAPDALSDMFSLLYYGSSAASESWGFHLGKVPVNTDPFSSAEIINAWYSEQTNGAFNQVIDPGKISGEGAGLIGIITTEFFGAWKDDMFVE